MGTFSPIVDYLTVRKIREGNGEAYAMGVTTTNNSALEQFLTAFGYTPGDIDENEHWVDIASYTPPVTSAEFHTPYTRRITLITEGARTVKTGFALAQKGGDFRLDIYNIKGRLMRSLNIPQREGAVTLRWDGRDKNGGRVGPGEYMVVLRSGKKIAGRKLIVLR
jgi:hypothetical protein